MFKYLILLSITIGSSLFAQVILSEVMFDPAGPEKSDEFVEIYNAGVVPVDLTGWEIGDSSAFDNLSGVGEGGMTLQPGQYGVILDRDYFSDSSSTYAGLIPPDALLLSIDGATLGNGGLSNSRAKTILLVNAQQDTVQRYRYSIGNLPGFSDEKIELTPGNGSANWADSREVNGTPGSKNSRTPAEVDLGIRRLQILTRAPQAGVPLTFSAEVYNAGRQTPQRFTWRQFIDLNRNRRVEAAEVQAIFESSIVPAPGDSLLLSGEFAGMGYGEADPGIALSLADDGDSSNQLITETVFVDDPAAVPLVINEIMADPLPGYHEWVEIYNSSAESVPLENLHFSDSRDTLSISAGDRMIPSGGYAVLAGDSAVLAEYTLNWEDVIILGQFPALNNDADEVSLLGPSGVAYDRVPYTGDWYRATTDRGTSLEKLNPRLDGRIGSSWAASVAGSGSTPAARNSLFFEVQSPENRLEIDPNPFSPDGDGFEDFTAIQYVLDLETAFADLRIFDLRGRLIRHLSNGERIAREGRFVWDGRDDQGRTARIGAYVCLLQIFDANQQRQETLKKTMILVKRD